MALGADADPPIDQRAPSTSPSRVTAMHVGMVCHQAGRGREVVDDGDVAQRRGHRRPAVRRAR